MTDGDTPNRRLRPDAWTAPVRVLVLLALSAGLGGLFELARLPAAFLLGPLAAAIILSLAGGAVRFPNPLFYVAQGIVGLMIATSFPASTLGEIMRDWPVFVAGTLSTVLASAVLGWLLMRSGLLPGTTAIWGSSPGAASVMTLMSAAYGADMRIVALMQYLRVLFCAVFASLIARAFGATVEGAHLVWFPPTAWGSLFATLALLAGSVTASILLRVPGGPLLLPMLVGSLVHFTGAFTLALPPWLLAIGYAVIGWAIGMRFTVDVLLHAARLLPRLLLSILALIGVCALFGIALSRVTGIDPLTAYLATSPGGADSVAIIAASAHADVPFVMAMQMTRFLFVLVAGPALARLLSDAAKRLGL